MKAVAITIDLETEEVSRDFFSGIDARVQAHNLINGIRENFPNRLFLTVGTEECNEYFGKYMTKLQFPNAFKNDFNGNFKKGDKIIYDRPKKSDPSITIPEKAIFIKYMNHPSIKIKCHDGELTSREKFIKLDTK